MFGCSAPAWRKGKQRQQMVRKRASYRERIYKQSRGNAMAWPWTTRCGEGDAVAPEQSVLVEWINYLLGPFDRRWTATSGMGLMEWARRSTGSSAMLCCAVLGVSGGLVIDGRATSADNKHWLLLLL